MKRTTIFIDEALEGDVRAVARRQGRPTSAVVRQALSEYVEREARWGRRLPGFVGIGKSGRSDVSETHEEWLWKKLTPHGDSPSRIAKKDAPGSRRKTTRTSRHRSAR